MSTACGPLKEEFRGHHFDDEESVEKFVCNWLQTWPVSFLDEGISSSPEEKNSLFIFDSSSTSNMFINFFSCEVD